MKKLLFALAVTTFTGCAKKQDPKPEPLKATYVCYSESGKFTLKCNTSAGWVTEKVFAQRFTKTVELAPDQLQSITQMVSDTLGTTDSIHIDGYLTGKVISKGVRSNIAGSVMNVFIQLSDAM